MFLIPLEAWIQRLLLVVFPNQLRYIAMRKYHMLPAGKEAGKFDSISTYFLLLPFL